MWTVGLLIAAVAAVVGLLAVCGAIVLVVVLAHGRKRGDGG
jgi:uncharacterized protein involved in exopolysaccharide biosynthesis